MNARNLAFDFGPNHVDEWLDNPTWADEPGERYARFWFEVARMPAWKQQLYRAFIGKLFCTHAGRRWRVTGASRLGDVWLASDFNRDSGYDLRVDVTLCTTWSSEK